MHFPNINTIHTKSSNLVEKIVLKNVATIEAWFRAHFKKTPASITTSVDLRHAGFKIAPVDTNLFPAGFNNLNEDFMPLCVQAAQSFIQDTLPTCTKILIIPENHTRNTFYLQSLYKLQDIFLKAGFLVKIGSFDENIQSPIYLKDIDKTLHIEPLEKNSNNDLKIKDFIPCLIILNNDLSSGIPEILKNVNQPIIPPAQLGWLSRLKSNHFKFYNKITQEFAELINIDSWLINSFFSSVKGIDFMAKEGLENLADNASELLFKVTEKYKEHNIKEKPFLAVKADNGTYGMSVIMIHDAKELLHLNRKQRTKMNSAKGGLTIDKVILQEGIYSFETMKDGAVAEPVVYILGQFVVGGFYRVHKGRGKSDNLNAPGMQFVPLAFSQACNMPHQNIMETSCPNRFYVYGVIARLAALAAAQEMAAVSKWSST